MYIYEYVDKSRDMEDVDVSGDMEDVDVSGDMEDVDVSRDMEDACQEIWKMCQEIWKMTLMIRFSEKSLRICQNIIIIKIVGYCLRIP